MSRQDLEHLNVLAILHYVMAGLTALTAVLPLLYFALGFAMLAGGAPQGVALAFIGFGGGFAAFLLGGGFMIGLCGYYLHKRKARTFIFIVAALQCTQMPLGTALGIFTILVLCRESVQEMFAHGADYHDPEDDDDRPPYFEDRDRFDREDRDRHDPEDRRDDWRREEPGYYGKDDRDY